MNSNKTLIFDIEKFAVNDGPGIRTVVFVKGCPLHCVWCHNPESQSFKPELFFNREKCTACGNCVDACSFSCRSVAGGKHLFDREKCSGCGACALRCAFGALKSSGVQMSAEEVLTEVLKDKPFYDNSGGGLTISGGEPLAHPDFTEELLRKAKENKIHTAVETSGFAPQKVIEKLFPLVDLWLWDIKAVPEKYPQLTGVPFGPIGENLKFIAVSHSRIILRCPLVPGINDEEKHLLNIARLANELDGVQGIDLEPYHPMGEGKCFQLGRVLTFHAEFASDSDKQRWKQTVSSNTSLPVNLF